MVLALRKNRFDEIFKRICLKKIKHKNIKSMFVPPFAITSNIAITLIGMIIPFFTFAVSLLGNAIKKKENEERDTKKQLHRNLDIQIVDIENKVKVAKETGDSKELEKQLEKLIENRGKADNQIKKVQQKYSLLNFQQSVVFPGSFLFCSVLLNEIAKSQDYEIAKSQDYVIGFILWILAIFGIIIAIYRICKSLSFIEEISISSEEIQTKKMIRVYRTALAEHEQEKEPELSIRLGNDSPLHCNINEELEIDFKIFLQKGKILKNSKVRFFIPDEFEIIDPSRYWKQELDFVIPEIRTIEIKMGDISKGTTSVRKKIKIKTPTQEGSYLLLYELCADGYKKNREELEISTT